MRNYTCLFISFWVVVNVQILWALDRCQLILTLFEMGYFGRRLKMWVFSTWKRLPEERRLEVEREKRREEMQRKVANILPDFKS